MRRAVWTGILWAFVCTLGCMAPVETRSSAPLVVDVGEAPEVIWVIKEFEADEKLFYGLFACYRRPYDNPGPPRCFLAETAGDVSELSWPGKIYVDDGVILDR